MHLSSIQIDEEESTTRWFPDLEQTYDYLAIALVGEVGEIANGVKKFDRESWSENRLIEYLQDELPDVLIYLVMLASHAGIDLEKAYIKKREFNEYRFGPPAETE